MDLLARFGGGGEGMVAPKNLGLGEGGRGGGGSQIHLNARDDENRRLIQNRRFNYCTQDKLQV